MIKSISSARSELYLKNVKDVQMQLCGQMAKIDSKKVWNKVFPLRIGDVGFLKSIEPKSGEAHYEYCKIVEVKRDGRLILQRLRDRQHSWLMADCSEKFFEKWEE